MPVVAMVACVVSLVTVRKLKRLWQGSIYTGKFRNLKVENLSQLPSEYEGYKSWQSDNYFILLNTSGILEENGELKRTIESFKRVDKQKVDEIESLSAQLNEKMTELSGMRKNLTREKKSYEELSSKDEELETNLEVFFVLWKNYITCS